MTSPRTVRLRHARWMVTAGVLALFCLFSFGTARLRARIHQQRRQALVTVDGGERAVAPAAAPTPLRVATAEVAAAAPAEPTGEDPAEPPTCAAAPAPHPLRGPPAAA